MKSNFWLASLSFAILATSFSAYADNSPMIEIGDSDSPVVIKLNDGRLGVRYRMQTDADGNTKFDTVQDLAVMDVTVSFFHDFVRLDFQGSTGASFDGSWNNSGIGKGDAGFALNLRRLSMTLNPTKGLGFSLGSMAPVYGAGSENSYLDSDGYITGYRARVTIDKGDLVVTGGFLGDLKDPNVFNRLDSLNDFNYLQAVFTQAIAGIAKASIEFDHMSEQNYVRGAVKFDVTKWTHFLDSVTLEDMVRVSVEDPANILAAKLTKKFKNVFAGRDLVADIGYLYRSSDMKLPLGDHVFMGQQMRVTVTVPNLVKVGPGNLGAFVDVVESLTDWEQVRAELGLVLKF